MHRNKRVRDHTKITRNQSKQVRWLGMGVKPCNSVTRAKSIMALKLVSVTQKYRVFLFLSNHCGFKHTHHIGTIQVGSDASKALRLILGTKDSTRLIKPFKLCVLVRVYLVMDFQCKCLGNIEYFQCFVIDNVTCRF